MCHSCYVRITGVLLCSFCWATGAAGQCWLVSNRDERKHRVSENWGACAWDFATEALRIACFILPSARIISASSSVVKLFAESSQMRGDGQVGQNPTRSPQALICPHKPLNSHFPSARQAAEQEVAGGWHGSVLGDWGSICTLVWVLGTCHTNRGAQTKLKLKKKKYNQKNKNKLINILK